MERAEAIIKLINTFHLNVEERTLFLDQPLSINELGSAIKDSIHRFGGYPKDWGPEQNFDGVYVTQTNSSYHTILKSEVGCMQFKLIEEKTFSNIVEVAHYVAQRMFSAGIDGVACNW